MRKGSGSPLAGSRIDDQGLMHPYPLIKLSAKPATIHKLSTGRPIGESTGYPQSIHSVDNTHLVTIHTVCYNCGGATTLFVLRVRVLTRAPQRPRPQGLPLLHDYPVTATLCVRASRPVWMSRVAPARFHNVE